MKVRVGRTTWSLIQGIEWPQKIWLLLPFLFSISIGVLPFLPESLSVWGSVGLLLLAILSLISVGFAGKLIESEKEHDYVFADDEYHRSERYGKFVLQISELDLNILSVEKTIEICSTQRELIRTNSFDMRALVNRSYAAIAFVLSLTIAVLGVVVTYVVPFLPQQPEDVQQSYVSSVETLASNAVIVVFVLILYFILAEFSVALISSFRSKSEELLEFKLFLEMYLLEQLQNDQYPGWR